MTSPAAHSEHTPNACAAAVLTLGVMVLAGTARAAAATTAAGVDRGWAGPDPAFIAIDAQGGLLEGSLGVRGGELMFEPATAGPGIPGVVRASELLVIEPWRAADLPALAVPGPGPDGRPRGAVLRLTDGQTVGIEQGFSADAESLHARSRWLGDVEVPLDRVDAVTLAPGAGMAASGDGAPGDPGQGGRDVVLLTTVDRVEGFVESISADGVTVDRDGRRLTVPIAGVAEIDLAAVAGPAASRLLGLADGTVLAVRGIDVIDDRTLLVTPTGLGGTESESGLARGGGGLPGAAEAAVGAELTVPIDRVASAWNTVRGVRAVPLRTCPIVRAGPLDGRAFATEPRVIDAGSGAKPTPGVGGVEIEGASETVYALPLGATRFRADAEAIGGAYTAFTLELVSLDSGGVPTPLGALAFPSDRHRETITLELPGGAASLVVRLRAGLSPVQDTLRLRRALVVVRDGPGD
jgi:hypothetical protein